jgi:hypothetical protein
MAVVGLCVLYDVVAYIFTTPNIQPYGLSTTMAISLAAGGPVTILWDKYMGKSSRPPRKTDVFSTRWVLVILISTAIAASLSEICSVYPTSAGVYYWQVFLLRYMEIYFG